MNEKAKKFVLHGIRTTDFRKKSSMIFLPFNILLSVVAILLWQGIGYICVVVVFILINIVCSIVFYKKWNMLYGFISQGVQLLLFTIELDLICYGMYRCVDLFVWYEYVIFICVQIVALVICVILNRVYYNVFENKKHMKRNVIVGSVAGFACECAILICKVWLTNVSLNVVITVISLLINVAIYFLLFVVCLAFYRAHLVLKYHLLPQFPDYN